MPPTATSAVVERTAGEVWTGSSGELTVYVPPDLAARLPAESLERCR